MSAAGGIGANKYKNGFRQHSSIRKKRGPISDGSPNRSPSLDRIHAAKHHVADGDLRGEIDPQPRQLQSPDRCHGRILQRPYRFGGQRVCENKQVRTDLLEEAVWEDLSSLLKNPKRVAEEYERRLRRTDKDGADFHELTSLIQKVKLAIARLIDAYQDGLLSRDEFQPRISRSKERLGKLEAEAATLTSRQSEADELRLTIGHLQEFHRHLHEGLEHVDWKTKRKSFAHWSNAWRSATSSSE